MPGVSVEVAAGEHQLRLCEGGHAVASYRVSIGSAGIDKQREGDDKTPLGTYALAAPTRSERFSLFIPVGYPTDEQRAHGFTGGEIGIHGPTRRTAWLGRFNTWTDWTRGCIAVGSDDDIAAIAHWVERNHVTRVTILR